MNLFEGEKSDALQELVRAGVEPSDFKFTMARDIGGAVLAADYSVLYTVIVERRGVVFAEGEHISYKGGHGENWVAEFGTDIQNGRFDGKPQ